MLRMQYFVQYNIFITLPTLRISGGLNKSETRREESQCGGAARLRCNYKRQPRRSITLSSLKFSTEKYRAAVPDEDRRCCHGEKDGGRQWW